MGARRVKKRRASKVVELDLRMPSLHRCWGNKAVSEVRAGLSSKRCTPEASLAHHQYYACLALAAEEAWGSLLLLFPAHATLLRATVIRWL